MNDEAQSRRTTPAKPDGAVRLGDSETDNGCTREWREESFQPVEHAQSSHGLRSLLFQRSLIPFQAREARETMDHERDVFVNQLHDADGGAHIRDMIYLLARPDIALSKRAP
jgi:hypothetical protein